MGGETSQHQQPMLGPYRQIIMFGDSLTEMSGNQAYVDDDGNSYYGFAFFPALQHQMVRRFDVLNRGFSGYNTAAAKIVLPQFMPSSTQAEVSLIAIFFGANDAAVKSDEPENQHVPLADYKKNLKAMIHDPALKNQSPRILLITPPPIEEYKLDDGWIAGLRKAAITKQYAEACCQVGKEENVAVLDLWTEMIKASGWDLSRPGIPGSKEQSKLPALSAFFTDGLHLSEKGYTLLYSLFSQKLKTVWPELNEMNGTEADNIFPPWRTAMVSIRAGQTIGPRQPRL